MSGFFSKKSAPVVEERDDDESELICDKHGNPGELLCECKYEILCDECKKDHAGLGH